jgi:hypothetical protein
MREAATRARRKTGGTCTTTRDLHFELVLRFREKHSRRPSSGATRLFRGVPGVYANKNTELNSSNAALSSGSRPPRLRLQPHPPRLATRTPYAFQVHHSKSVTTHRDHH